MGIDSTPRTMDDGVSSGGGRKSNSRGARLDAGHVPPPAPQTSMLPSTEASSGSGADDEAADIYSRPTMILEGDSDERIMAWAAELSGPNRGQLHALLRRGTRVGRSGDNDIVFPDPRMSREHCFIEVEEKSDGSSSCWLVDRESERGTYVNGERVVNRQRLENNDRIVMADTELLFKQLPPLRSGG